MEKPSIFLSLDEAVEAIQIDFRQYAPQWMLFSSILKLITDQKAYIAAEPANNGAWLHEEGRPAMRWLDGPALIEHMCRTVAGAHWTPELLASVCSRVFQNRAVVDAATRKDTVGIRIQTGMEAFECRQCGRCCRNLDYHNELTAEDVARWKALDRNDILKWVGTFKTGEREKTTYRIWITPGTRKLAEICPFLKKVPTENRWICGIHDVKPAICRNYPVSRKHATMTGCPGFKLQKPEDSRSPL
jgi:Fe-S-cluster containining protein